MGEYYGEEPELNIRLKSKEETEEIAKEVERLNSEIESFKRTILNAEAALDSAEQDMDEILSGLTC